MRAAAADGAFRHVARCTRCNAQLVAAVRSGAVALATSKKHLRSGSLDVGALFHGGAGVASPPTAARYTRRAPHRWRRHFCQQTQS